MTDFPTDFPLIDRLTPESRRGRVRAALDLLRLSVEEGQIRKAELDDVKFVLGRSVERVWEAHVADPHFHARQFERQPEEVRALYFSVSISSLHDILSSARKIEKSGASGPVCDKMREVMAECLPLAQAVADLKSKVVKGRAPRERPVTPPNPHKQTGTCACCQKEQAVKPADGKMAHHGYRRPGDGYQTSSCAGVSFPPLEVSTEGLVWLINAEVAAVAARKRLVEDPSLITSLPRPKTSSRHAAPSPPLERGEDGFDRLLSLKLRELRAEIPHIESGIERLGEDLAVWERWHADRNAGAPAP